MSLLRTSTTDHVPDDPVGEAVAAAVMETLEGASVELVYSPVDAVEAPTLDDEAVACAVGAGPPGWNVRLAVWLGGRISPLVAPDSPTLLAMLEALPAAALRAADHVRSTGSGAAAPLSPALRRALRDMIIVEVLTHLQAVQADTTVMAGLLADTVEFLIELSGRRVESQDLTHGVIITDVLEEPPGLQFGYPNDLRAAKRGPLLFDGKQAVLLVDGLGRMRTEIPRHHLDHLRPNAEGLGVVASEMVDSGSLVAAATRLYGGIGFFLRDDRSIWVFVEGRPLVVRSGEHWTAFPLELAASIDNMIGGGDAASLVVQAAFIVSARRRGAILAIVDDAKSLDGVVSTKDRYDLRNEFDPMAMRVETRLHHLIDASDLDGQTVARLASLDGATVLDRDANLLAYGAIVASADSQNEGARTAAAKTLSETAEVVLKISVDGDITVFHKGEMVATLLGQGPDT